MSTSSTKLKAFYKELENLREEVEKHTSPWIAYQSYKNKCNKIFSSWRTEIMSRVIEIGIDERTIKNIDKLIEALYEESRKKVGKTNFVRECLKETTKIFLKEILLKKKKLPIKPKILPLALLKKLRSNFKTEIRDLELVYGRSGTCTAFLLRKILEKALFLALVKTGFEEEKLKDKSGKYVGLDRLLDIAANWKVDKIPFLMPKTIEKVKGIKFLGDVAAHNYLANVDMEEIVLHMPYIIIALKELSRWLN